VIGTKVDRMDQSFSEEAIEAEHNRLGHSLGWRFLYGPKRALHTAEVAVISLNPAGDRYEPPAWSCEDGSAYVRESWKGRPPGAENHQVQIRRMLDLLHVVPENVVAGTFVPFRSPRWKDLANQHASVVFGERLWRWALANSPVTKIVVVGRLGGLDRLVCDIAQCRTLVQEVSAGWGDQKLRKYTDGAGRIVVSIPHVSQFKIFGRPAGDSAFAKIMKPSPSQDFFSSHSPPISDSNVTP
jgi:hypothetical protein